VVGEHFRGDIGRIFVFRLQAALTTLPRARSVKPYHGNYGKYGEDVQLEALVEWLRGGGGAGITVIVTWPEKNCVAYRSHHAFRCNIAHRFVNAMLRGGALPSLKSVDVHLHEETQRASLAEGLLAAVNELRVKMVCRVEELGPQLAVLGLVRQLPALTTLEIRTYNDEDDPVEWPPFIPPSLKVLKIEMLQRGDGGGSRESLLRALPGMLGASGARLERLHLTIPGELQDVVDGLAHVAQALRCCSPTLTSLRLVTDPSYAQPRWSWG
jgi:hypothetical protein